MTDANSPQEMIRRLLEDAGSDDGVPVEEAPSTGRKRPSSAGIGKASAPTPPVVPAAPEPTPAPLAEELPGEAEEPPAPTPTPPVNEPESSPPARGGLSLTALKQKANAGKARAPGPPGPAPDEILTPEPLEAPQANDTLAESPEREDIADFALPDLFNDGTFDDFAIPPDAPIPEAQEPASRAAVDGQASSEPIAPSDTGETSDEDAAFLARIAGLRQQSEELVARAAGGASAPKTEVLPPGFAQDAPGPAVTDIGAFDMPDFNLDFVEPPAELTPVVPPERHPTFAIDRQSPPLPFDDEVPAPQAPAGAEVAPETAPGAEETEEELERLHREATERAATMAARRDELAARKIREAAERERAALLAQTDEEIIRKRADIDTQQHALDAAAATLETRKAADLVELEGLRGQARADAEGERARMLDEANAVIATRQAEIDAQQRALDEAAAALESRKQAYKIELEELRSQAKASIEAMWSEVRAEKNEADARRAAAEEAAREAETRRLAVASDHAALEVRTSQERERLGNEREALRAEMSMLQQAMLSEAVNQAKSLAQEANAQADIRIKDEMARVAEKESQVDNRLRALLNREQADEEARASAQAAVLAIAEVQRQAVEEAERWHAQAQELSIAAAQADARVVEMQAELAAARLTQSTQDDERSDERVREALRAQLAAETASQRAQAELAKANEIVVSLAAQQLVTQKRAELAEAAMARNQEAHRLLDVQQEGVRETRRNLEEYRDQFGMPAEETTAPGAGGESATPEARTDEDLFDFDLGDFTGETDETDASAAQEVPFAPSAILPEKMIFADEKIEAPDERLSGDVAGLDFEANVPPPETEDLAPPASGTPIRPSLLEPPASSRRNPLVSDVDESGRPAQPPKPPTVAPSPPLPLPSKARAPARVPAPIAAPEEKSKPSLDLGMLDEAFDEVPQAPVRPVESAADLTSAMPASQPDDLAFVPITESEDQETVRLRGLDYAHAAKGDEPPDLHFLNLRESDQAPMVLGVEASAVGRNEPTTRGGILFTIVVLLPIVLLAFGAFYFFGNAIAAAANSFSHDPGGSLNQLLKSIERFFGV